MSDRPLGWAMLSMVAVVPFTATVKPVRLVTGLMLSLKVMWISVPSTEVSGLFAPVVIRVGRMPSILSPASGPTSSWVSDGVDGCAAGLPDGAAVERELVLHQRHGHLVLLVLILRA